MMMGVVFSQNEGLEIFIMKYYATYANISYVISKYYINILEYVGCIQGENERPQVCVYSRFNIS